MKHRKIIQFKNKNLNYLFGGLCIFSLFLLIFGIVLGIIGYNKFDYSLMKTSIIISVCAGIIMGFLHIIYFRKSKIFKKLYK